MATANIPLLARFALAGAGWLFVAFYLVQQALIAPQEMDEGLCLELIDAIAHGQRPFWDFVDAYGPFHYQLPALFYALAGNKAWGVRVFIFLAKLATAVLTFAVVRAVTNRFTAWLSLVFATVLLGLPWQTLQTPYASLHCAPLIVGAYGLLVCRPLGARPSVVLAAVLTTAVLFIKVNSGAFLFAGGVLYTLCITPGTEASEDKAVSSRRRTALGALQGAAVIICVAAFLWFARNKPDPLLYLYLDVPLLLGGGWALSRVFSDYRGHVDSSHRVIDANVYAGTTLGLTAVAALAYFGWDGIGVYVRETSLLLSHIDYVRPRLPLGALGVYPEFNRYLWPQLPWLSALCFSAWWWLGGKRRATQVISDAELARAGGLWVMTALGTFVLNSLGTEIHAVGAAWPACPALFVVGYQLVERSLKGAVPRIRALRAAIAGLVLAWCATIFTMPTVSRLRPANDWTVSSRAGKGPRDNRLEYLRFRPPVADGESAATYLIPGNVRDGHTNEAAMFVDEITEDGEEVLVLTLQQIITFHSFTSQVGGRYRFLFYLARTGLLGREGLTALAPGLLESLIRHPPRVIVTMEGGIPPLLGGFPELSRLAERFRPARVFGNILVLTRNDLILPEQRKE